MKPTDDEKILQVYFGEAEQKDLDHCLQSQELCQQLDQLEADMKIIENAPNSLELPEDYGQQLWHKIADRLGEPTTRAKTSNSWLNHLKQMFLVPQYSLASFVAVLGLVMLAFYAGRQQSNEVMGSDIQEQLLAQNIQLHLTQSEIFLTQVSNGNGRYNSQATAQRLLSSNRIFKQALTNHQGQFTSQILQDLEPILLEYANGSPVNTPNQTHGQQPQANWVNDSKSIDLPNNLLFQIKAMKQQLAQKNDII
jgi:hypothetical protein